MKRLSRLLDFASEYFASRKGLLPFLGIFLIIVNAVLRILFSTGFFVETDLLLHLGAVIAILGLMLAWAL